MENSYGFEVNMSCVYNEGKGYDAGINVTTSDGGSASYECSAKSLTDLIDKISGEGMDTVILPVLFEPKPKTPEEQIAELTAQVNQLMEENKKLRAAKPSGKKNRKVSSNPKSEYDPESYYNLLNLLLK